MEEGVGNEGGSGGDLIGSEFNFDFEGISDADLERLMVAVEREMELDRLEKERVERMRRYEVDDPLGVEYKVELPVRMVVRRKEVSCLLDIWMS
jgi:hypothetical protein